MTANSSHAINTWGQNGAEGGIAAAGGVAIAIASDQTTASIGSDAQALNATGGLTIDASGTFSVSSLADTAANPSGSVGLGASVVVNVTQDSFLAELGRNVTAGGPVSVTDEAIASSQATAVASEQGAGNERRFGRTSSRKTSLHSHIPKAVRMRPMYRRPRPQTAR